MSWEGESLSPPMGLTQHIAHSSHGGQENSSCDKPLDERASIYLCHVLWGPDRRAVAATETFIVLHDLIDRPYGFLEFLIDRIMKGDGPLNEVCSRIQKGRQRVGGDMGRIVGATDRTGKQVRQRLVKVFCAFFIRIGGILGVADGDQMNRMPKEGSPYARGKLHSITRCVLWAH